MIIHTALNCQDGREGWHRWKSNYWPSHLDFICFSAFFSFTLSFLSIFPPFLHLTLTSQGVGMANKGPSFGLSRQVQDKIDSKYDPELEQILVEWIVRQCGSGVGRPDGGKTGFQTWLKDGCVSASTSGW